MTKRLSAFLFLCAAVHASSPAAWEMNSYDDFVSGKLDGLSLTRDGRLTPSPKLEALFASDQPIIWSVARAADGTIYAATGHRGRVYRIDPAGKASLYWQSDQPEVFALALDSKGVLYAASSPDGKIYRIEDGKAVERFTPGAKYIWSLAFGPDGALYAGTGDLGRIYRVSAAGKGEIYYDTGQSHVTCLAFDAQGRLLAGSEPNGVLYRITAKDKGFTLYDANLPEIRAIVPAADGVIYAAALGGGMSRRTLGGVQSAPGTPSSASVTAVTTTITVEAQQGLDVKPRADTAKPAVAAAQPAPLAAVDVSGVEKSAIYRIGADNTVETLWTSKEENVYDLLVARDQITFATDGQGRIYRMGPDRKATLLAQTNEGEATRLLETPSGVVAATGDMGKLVRLLSQAAASGSFESPVHDSNTVARWGRLRWRAESPAGGRVTIRTRTGNSLRPDKTWSDWSEPLTDAGGSQVASPNARYIQWKAELTGGAALSGVEAAYLPQNTPPVVKSVAVASQMAAASAQPAATPQPSANVYSITVTDTGDAGPATSAGTSTQNVSQPGAKQLQIVWQAEDADGDKLAYSLYFRGEDEREWKTLKSNIAENIVTLDADSLADGRYLFRVTATDSPSNPPNAAREAELLSSPILVDNTPPTVTLGAPKRTGQRIEIEADAADAASPLRRAEYSIDAGPWIPVEPVEGILDSQRERFLIRLDSAPAGERLVVVRAVDSAGNAGLAKTIVR